MIRGCFAGKSPSQHFNNPMPLILNTFLEAMISHGFSRRFPHSIGFFLGCLILQGWDFDFPLTLQVSLEMGHCPKRIGYNDMYIMGI
jgi:hypothetical protein